MNALTGACRGLYGGLGVWDAGQRDSGAAVWASVALWAAVGTGAGSGHLGTLGAVWGGLGTLCGAGHGARAA